METNADDDEQDGFIDASCSSEFKSVDKNQKRFPTKIIYYSEAEALRVSRLNLLAGGYATGNTR
jgi:hypothetical protein